MRLPHALPWTEPKSGGTTGRLAVCGEMGDGGNTVSCSTNSANVGLRVKNKSLAPLACCFAFIQLDTFVSYDIYFHTFCVCVWVRVWNVVWAASKRRRCQLCVSECDLVCICKILYAHAALCNKNKYFLDCGFYITFNIVHSAFLSYLWASTKQQPKNNTKKKRKMMKPMVLMCVCVCVS